MKIIWNEKKTWTGGSLWPNFHKLRDFDMFSEANINKKGSVKSQKNKLTKFSQKWWEWNTKVDNKFKDKEESHLMELPEETCYEWCSGLRNTIIEFVS